MDYQLSVGGHANPSQGRCAMEWIAFLCGEPHNARPSKVSHIMRHMMVYLNDSLGDEQRQRLRPYLTRCIGTVDDGHDEMRRHKWPVIEQTLSGVRRAYERFGIEPRAGWLDPFADAFFAPGGLLDQMLPLERVEVPEQQKEANTANAFASAMKTVYADLVGSPPVLIDWKQKAMQGEAVDLPF